MPKGPATLDRSKSLVSQSPPTGIHPSTESHLHPPSLNITSESDAKRGRTSAEATGKSETTKAALANESVLIQLLLFQNLATEGGKVQPPHHG